MNDPSARPGPGADSPPDPGVEPAPLAGGAVFALLGATVVLDTVVQILWKRVAAALPGALDPWLLAGSLLQLPAAWLLAVLFLGQLALWTRLLAHVDLSFAQPITALSYLGVAGLSVAVLGESFDLRKAASIGLILCGVWLIGGTPMRSSRRGAVAPRAGAAPAPPATGP